MPLVCGAGVNDSGYRVKKEALVDGVTRQVWVCPFYQAWKSMLERAYCPKHKKKRPTYKDVTCCEEWLLFSNFKAWMLTQDWEGKQLDKDLIEPGNKEYKPSACVFVSKSLNSFLTENDASRGPYPIGTHWCKKAKKFVAKCGNLITKKREELGSFDCPHEAHKAWLRRKHEIACQLADLQTNPRVAEALRVRYQPAAE